MATFIQDYQGYSIFLEEGDGFYWSNKSQTFAGDGFFETIEEAQQSINNHNYSEREAFPELYTHDDTPSLPSLPLK